MRSVGIRRIGPLALVASAALAPISITRAIADGDIAYLEERYVADDANAPPVLVLDPMLRPGIETFGTVEVRHGARFHALGTRLTAAGIERLNERDVFTRGWQAQVALSRDLGLVRLTAQASVETLQSSNLIVVPEGTRRFGSSSYVDTSIALTRTFKRSRWNAAWISLSLTRRHWIGDRPVPGEQDSTQFMLSIGTTF